jgi:hypothetical protein
MVCNRIGCWCGAGKPLIHLADAGKATLGALAHALQPVPVDHGNAVLEAVAASQVQKSGEISWLRDMRADSNRKTGAGVPPASAFSYFRLYDCRNAIALPRKG